MAGPDDCPKRRKTDGKQWWRVLIRENAYRDVWLAVISAVLLWAAISSYHASHSARGAVHAVQVERRAATMRTCLDQNKRHDNTFAALDKLQARDVHEANTPEQRKRAVETVDGTKALIDAIAPKAKSCKKFTDERVGRIVP